MDLLRRFRHGVRMRGGARARRQNARRDKGRRRPIAQQDVYRAIGRQVPPRRNVLLEHGVAGGVIMDIEDTAEAEAHFFQPPRGG